MVVENCDLDTPRTRDLVAKLAQLGVTTPLIVTESGTEALYLAARNLPYVEVRDVQGMDPVSLVGSEYVVITAEAVKKVEERSEEHTSELQSLMRISYAVFCLKKKSTTALSNTTNNRIAQRQIHK